jgi:hypothetical protein
MRDFLAKLFLLKTNNDQEISFVADGYNSNAKKISFVADGYNSNVRQSRSLFWLFDDSSDYEKVDYTGLFNFTDD